jgi:hypothetical protein
MCAATPIWCPTCSDALIVKGCSQAACCVGHLFAFDDLAAEGTQVITRYHAAGRSLLMRKTLCSRCAPL